jgi:hypothetical protein
MNRKLSAGSGAGFVGVGVAFLAIGLSGKGAFTAIGLAFFVLGLGALARKG